jgi:peptidoglycan lytic transglycosylase
MMILLYWDPSTRGLSCEPMRKLALTFLLLFPLVLPAQNLESLVRACRERPNAARRDAIARFAAAHPKDSQGAIALFALGVIESENESYPEAIRRLSAARKRLPQLDDYIAFHLGEAHLETSDPAAAASELRTVLAATPPSPFSGRAAILSAKAYTEAGTPNDAIVVLRTDYVRLPQPAGDLALASALESAGDLPAAAGYYQRVYFQFPAASEASTAASALDRLRAAMGAGYPPPMPHAMLERAGKWLEAREYSRARDEFEALIPRLGGLERDLASVRIGVADYMAQRTQSAYQYLKSLESLLPEAAAERLYYLTACARRLEDTQAMQGYLAELGRLHPQSEWRLKALVWAANEYLLRNEVAAYEPLYRACYESFPASAEASNCHWKVAWAEWMRRTPTAPALMAEHLSRYPESPKASAALYFLGRSAEEAGRIGEARALYRKVVVHFPNRYYAFLCEDRLYQGPLARIEGSDAPPTAFDGLQLPVRGGPVSFEPGEQSRVRIARSRLLASAGLQDFADAELRFEARGNGDAPSLALELARQAARRGIPESAIRHIKGVWPTYLYTPLESAPTEFWQLAFPLPYRQSLEKYGRQQDLDPFVLAGLIRQESEFDPKAISRARAYGLMQVLPSTGRSLARKTRSGRFRSSLLFRPDYNIRLGTYYFRTRLDELGGDVEAALAAYNGGKSRVDVWTTWGPFREPAEFIETIPFTETRTYVQIVLANAEVYRRLYGPKAPAVTSTDGASRKRAVAGKK